MLAIVFYTTNGAAAKVRSREICAQVKGNYARCYDAAVWDGSNDKCDEVEIMPDVTGWHRKRIVKVYGDKVVDHEVEMQKQEVVNEIVQQEDIIEGTKTAVHRGGGRWFVMDGEQIISGPHDKSEANRLASEGVAA